VARRWNLAATAALVLLSGCGSSGGQAPAPASTSVTPAAGARLRGSDYALVLAPGWRDTTKQHRRTARVDRVMSEQRPRAVAVVAVLAVSPGHASTATLLRARARREIAAAHATTVTRTRSLTLDGAPAITYEYRDTSPAGAKIQSRQVLAFHGRRLHVITLVAGRTQFAGADTALGSMLGSWRWGT
jgi:hypothetical protein